jgi:hypothetical protein
MVDSETRWRLVKKQKTRPIDAPAKAIIRPATANDLPQVKDIYNFYIQNTVITGICLRFSMAAKNQLSKNC